MTHTIHAGKMNNVTLAWARCHITPYAYIGLSAVCFSMPPAFLSLYLAIAAPRWSLHVYEGHFAEASGQGFFSWGQVAFWLHWFTLIITSYYHLSFHATIFSFIDWYIDYATLNISFTPLRRHRVIAFIDWFLFAMPLRWPYATLDTLLHAAISMPVTIAFSASWGCATWAPAIDAMSLPTNVDTRAGGQTLRH